MALNTYTTILRCLETCQESISNIIGIPTQAIDETKNNINYIRSTITSVIDNSTDVFNALKNSANSFSIIAGLGSKIQNEQASTQGFATQNDYIVNQKDTDRYAIFMTISTILSGGEIGEYSGISRGTFVKLNGDVVPNSLGRSLINNMLYAINNFVIVDLGYATTEQSHNIVLIIETFKYLMLTNICRIAIRTDFFSQEELLEYKDLIKTGFDNYLNDLSSTESTGASAIGVGSSTTQVDNNVLFEVGDRMRETIINQMLLLAEGLSKSYNYIPKAGPENSLVLAYDKYEDINRSEEIYFRNKEQIKHPGFLPGGDKIRILDK
jgi:hypothetical protein